METPPRIGFLGGVLFCHVVIPVPIYITESSTPNSRIPPVPSTTRLFLSLGAFSAMLSVMIGAFGAHALRARVTPDLLAVYHTGAQYHFYHSLGLLAIAAFAARFPHIAALKWSGWLMVVGILLFSGSLYILALTGIRTFGAVTPLGGVAFILAWALLAVSALRAP